jgi:hypothetical protein
VRAAENANIGFSAGHPNSQLRYILINGVAENVFGSIGFDKGHELGTRLLPYIDMWRALVNFSGKGSALNRVPSRKHGNGDVRLVANARDSVLASRPMHAGYVFDNRDDHSQHAAIRMNKWKPFPL